MIKNIINNSGLLVIVILIFFISGCACNPTWKEGFLKGALIGAALGGAEGVVVGDDDESEDAAIGVGIGALVGGIIGAFINRCEEEPVAVVEVQDSDTDDDGVLDSLDQCPYTPLGIEVDYKGCPLDTDGDGIFDSMDQCPGTPGGANVDAQGCPLDSDGDGVYDYLDQCPNTSVGVKVDDKGCSLDSDGDGVYDYIDKCPGTPKGAEVNEMGCWVLKDVYFDTNKWDIKSQCYPALGKVVEVLNRNPGLRIEIQGHTDNIGAEKYNQNLSEKRARAVMEYIIEKGINEDRLTAVGYGFTRPIASNSTPEGRSLNRRTQIAPIN
ncbi:OmpA family protein [Deltaproteobacteria bacterium]|nr:OmpA family protein [Deltaproteobacteria bacterium]